MNIGSLIRTVMGEPQGSQAKVLDMKQGSVVRGVVVRDLGNQEAMVAINGVQVRAKLETPINQGDTTMLEVQGETESGEIILKPIPNSEMISNAATRGELLKSFGVTNTEANREMLSHMQEAGVPLTKENVQKFATLLAEKPVHVDVKAWVGAAAVAQARGIPLSPSTVNAMLEAMTGPTLTEHLGKLEAGIQSVLKDMGQTLSSDVRTALAKAIGLLHEVEQAVGSAQRGTTAAGSSAAQAPAAGSMARDPAAMHAAGSRGDTRPATASSAGGGTGVIAHAQQAHGQGASPGGANTPGAAAPAPSPAGGWIGGVLKLLGVEHENLLAKAVLANGTSAGAVDGAPDAPTGQQATSAGQVKPDAPHTGQVLQSSTLTAKTAGQLANPIQTLVSPTGTQSPSPSVNSGAAQAVGTNAGAHASSQTNQSNQPSQQATATGHAIASTMVQTGSTPTVAGNQADAEQPASLLSHTNTGAQGSTAVRHATEGINYLAKTINPLEAGSILPSTSQGDQAIQQAARESLKSVLLTLSASNELPPALKEAMHNAVQHITGQQLLLSNDRTNPFAHVTMFIPFTNGEGQQTAAVHIQSRRGDKGTLDSSNCRLLFDLQMSAMGDTLVDVNVVNSIVSLHVHNDHEEVGYLIEGFRDEIAKGVNDLGFQFLSLKCSPFPQETVAALSSGQQSPVTGDREISPLFMPKPYKGVDYRA
ncbi:hypothetical protein NV379_06010 [Paenibacillus sp. N1-5-1-14]|uniref:hypothetical protein n=1 Tax=Paenibacillus radicibacter TaxID=2972488 RepID=UPI0021591825|nr:hypothetical protein [Paenibacillus radicibacter]MCR8642210.1 hypothetical protein [Paenibacillus radicibacter]